MPRANQYKGAMSPTEARQKISKAASRIGAGTTAQVSNDAATKAGMRLSFVVDGVQVERSCGSQPTQRQNLACLALWFGDMALNVDRGIETFAEAFGSEALTQATGPQQPRSPYKGTKSRDDSLASIAKSLQRLGLTEKSAAVRWAATGEATIRLLLPSGRIAVKTSQAQADARSNVAVLALWLQVRAKNYERGIDELDGLFAGNLLPEGKKDGN